MASENNNNSDHEEQVRMSKDPIYINMFEQLKDASKSGDINTFREFELSFRTEDEQKRLKRLFINNKLFDEDERTLLLFLCGHFKRDTYYNNNSNIFDCIKYLINDWKADVNIPDKYGMTILMMFSKAEDSPNCGKVKYLVNNANADVDLLDNNGRPALAYAPIDSMIYTFLLEKSSVETCRHSLSKNTELLFEKLLKQREIEWAAEFFGPDGPGGQAMIKANNLLEEFQKMEKETNNNNK